MGPRMAKGISKRSQTPGNLWNIGFQGTLVMIFIINSDDIFWWINRGFLDNLVR